MIGSRPHPVSPGASAELPTNRIRRPAHAWAHAGHPRPRLRRRLPERRASARRCPRLPPERVRHRSPRRHISGHPAASLHPWGNPCSLATPPALLTSSWG